MSKTFNPGMGVVSRTKSRNASYNNQRKQYPTDLYVRVLEVHPSDGNKGYIDGTNINGKRVRIFIDEEAYLRNEQRQREKRESNQSPQKIKFMGYKIDNNMKKHIEPENPKFKKVIMATQAMYQQTKQINGESVSFYTAKWIDHITNTSSKKFRQAPITLFSTRSNENSNTFSVRYVQVWNDSGSIQLNDKENLQKLAEKFDEANACEDHSITPYVFKFRTLVTNPDKKVVNSERPLVVIHETEGFDYVYLDGSETGTAPTGEFLLSSAEQYQAFIADYQELHDMFPESEFFTEVVYGNSYKATSFGLSYTNAQTGSPLYQMSNTVTGYSVDDNEKVIGKNYGGRMWFLLSPDQTKKVMTADDDGEEKEVEYTEYSNFVNRLYPNVNKNNINYYIPSSALLSRLPENASDEDKQKITLVAIHPALGVVKNSDRKVMNEENDEKVNQRMEKEPDEIHVYDEPETPVQTQHQETSNRPADVPVDDIDDDIPF